MNGPKLILAAPRVRNDLRAAIRAVLPPRSVVEHASDHWRYRAPASLRLRSIRKHARRAARRTSVVRRGGIDGEVRGLRCGTSVCRCRFGRRRFNNGEMS